jgi:hypothetical protein
LGAHNIQIQKGQKSTELDLIFYNSKTDRIELLIECTLSCDTKSVQEKINNLNSFINELDIKVNEKFVQNPLQRIDPR